MAEDLICSGRKRGRDLTIDTLKISGKEPVRDLVILTPQDVKQKRQGKNFFELSYRLSNLGFMASKDFDNAAYFNDKVACQQPNLALRPNEEQLIKDSMSLDPVDGTLLVRIDVFSKIAEDDETNNDLSTKVTFRGFQANSPKEPQLHIELLRISGRVPIQNRAKVTKRDSKGEKKGRHAFTVEYVMRNFGLQKAEGFDNFFLLDGKRFFRQKGLSLEPGESRIVKEPVYVPIHQGKFSIRIDGEKKYKSGQGCNRELSCQLYFQGFNRV